jgi:hypothetical protein
MKCAWFRSRNWDYVIAVNEGLCRNGNALHKPTTDGYEVTKALWGASQEREMTLAEAVELCRQCHRSAPFCFYNGNTFVAIIRDCIAHVGDLTPEQTALARSLAGHMVAGTAEPEEIVQFEQLLRDIDQGGARPASVREFQVGDRVQTLKGTLTGIVVHLTSDGAITWKCDQTGAQMTGTARTLKSYP